MVSLRRLAASGANRTLVSKIVLVIGLLVWPVFYRGSYGLSVMTTAGLYAIVTLGVVVILGQAGQLSFGHSAFYGIGAYGAGLFAANLQVPTVLSLIGGAAAAGVVSLIIGLAVSKLRYFYLALATIGLGQIFLVLVIQLRSVTGGPLGFAFIPSLGIGGLSADSSLSRYYLVWVFAGATLLLLARALKYRFGRAVRALATSEIASQTLGVKTARWKLLAFVTSAIVCGLAGGLFAFTAGGVSPNSFTFSAAVLPIVMMLVGGGGSTWGAIIGAIVMTWVIYGFSGIQEWSGVAYSLLMIVLLVVFPAGLALTTGQRTWLKALFFRERLRESPSARETEGGTSGVQASVDPGATVELQTHLEAQRLSAGSMETGDTGAQLLRLEGICVEFGGLRAVEDVSLEVRPGQIVALIGPNGAGKTTLFNTVSRLQALASGSVFFAGKDVTKSHPADVSRLGMARTFQNLRIYANMSVLENVLVGCHRHERSGFWASALGLPGQRKEERLSRERAMNTLSFLGMAWCADLPAASLPYGQQRLVEIARALASEPRLLLLDEPAAGLNRSERADLVEKISRIRDSGITVLIVEHDVELVLGLSEYVYVLDYGRLIFEGAPEAARASLEVIEAYLGTGSAQRTDLCKTRGLMDNTCEAPEQLLDVRDLSVSYGSVKAVEDVSFTVHQGEVMAILGANGAGKSTLLHTVSGLLKPRMGSIVYQGREITGVGANTITSRGLCQVLERRRLFPDLSVQDNLIMGASGRRAQRSAIDEDIARVYDLFPRLKERRKQAASTLSGGEQQMLAIGRALLGKPELLLLDEPSMGLAPIVVERIFESLAELNAQGLTLLVVEQNADLALSLAHRGLVLQNGRVAVSGSAEVLKADERVRDGYLGKGLASAGN